jgi:nickel-dependent lactate racemase
MIVELAYGRAGLTVELPEERTTVVEPVYVEGLADERAVLAKAMESPIDSAPLADLGRNAKSACIAICDVTRPMPSHIVIPEVLKQLRHVPRDKITILVATGTHRPSTQEELAQMLGKNILDQFSVVNHRATDKSSLERCGEASDGTPIWLNRDWVEADLRITTGFAEPHFFAGFSGGPKLVAPGLAGIETIMSLHRAQLIGHPSATWGLIEENQLHKVIREIAATTGVSFAIDVTINRDHEITGVFAGELFKEHRAACSFARKNAMQPVDSPFDVVLTTNSGYPLDLNLYQSVKGMSAAARVVKQDGAIICAAECSDGIPQHGEYAEILASAPNPPALLEMINCTGYSRQDQWQAQVQALVQLKAQVYLKSSYLTPEQVRAAHLEPVEDVAAAVLRELENRGPDATVCVLPEGPQTIPFLKSEVECASVPFASDSL